VFTTGGPYTVRARFRNAFTIPSNDFSLHDHVLDTTAMLGAVPAIYGWKGGQIGLETYFAMVRGAQLSGSQGSKLAIPRSEYEGQYRPRLRKNVISGCR
jgi:hypothetical protein